MNNTTNPTSKNRIVSLAVLVVVIILVAVFVAYSLLNKKDSPNTDLSGMFGDVATSTLGSSGSSSSAYTSTSYGFSFTAVPGVTIKEVPGDKSTQTILFSRGDSGVIAQLYISQFDGTAADLTEQNIATDTGLKISNFKIGFISKNVKAVVFTNVSSSPATQQVWFIYYGNLYQLSGTLTASDILSSVVGSFKFN